MSNDLKDRSKCFALRIIKLVNSLPKTLAAGTIGKQLIRSGTSVAANYRAACRARSKAEFIAKMGDSLRELSETEYWLELLIESTTINSNAMTPLLQETRELKAIFSTIIRKARSA